MKNVKKWYEETKVKTSEKLTEIKQEYRYLIKPFVILMLIFVIAFYPIIRANFDYIDDMGRVTWGYREWTNFSRFTTEYLSSFVHTSKYLTDISPLTQLLAVAFLALAGTMLLHLFKQEKKIRFMQILAVVPLGLSPYFLECISYKFDAPYMALAILASILPFILYGAKRMKKILFAIAILIGTLIMCTTYQAASGIIPMVALFLALKYWNNKETKEALKLLGITAASYLLGLVIFKVFIMIPFDGYVSNSLLPLKELIPGFIGNLKIYYYNVRTDFRKIWLILIAIIAISFLIVSTKQSKQKKILAFFVSGAVLLLTMLLTFGLYPALMKPSFEPRTMFGFGILIALLGVNATNQKKLYIPKAVMFVLCWCFITFAATYGNALSQQQRYIDFRVQPVIESLGELDIMKTDEIKRVKIVGDAGKAPSIEHMQGGYANLINKLVLQTFSGDWVWHELYFLNYFKIPNIELEGVDAPVEENLELVKDTMYYSISTNHTDYVLIEIK